MPVRASFLVVINHVGHIDIGPRNAEVVARVVSDDGVLTACNYTTNAPYKVRSADRCFLRPKSHELLIILLDTRARAGLQEVLFILVVDGVLDNDTFVQEDKFY